MSRPACPRCGLPIRSDYPMPGDLCDQCRKALRWERASASGLPVVPMFPELETFPEGDRRRQEELEL
jgi:hypothetical protein